MKDKKVYFSDIYELLAAMWDVLENENCVTVVADLVTCWDLFTETEVDIDFDRVIIINNKDGDANDLNMIGMPYMFTIFDYGSNPLIRLEPIYDMTKDRFHKLSGTVFYDADLPSEFKRNHLNTCNGTEFAFGTKPVVTYVTLTNDDGEEIEMEVGQDINDVIKLLEK